MQIGYQAYLMVMINNHPEIIDGVPLQLNPEYFKIHSEYFKFTVG